MALSVYFTTTERPLASLCLVDGATLACGLTTGSIELWSIPFAHHNFGAAAQTLMKQSPAAAFVYLSGAGTKRTSSMMWARVKAEAEDQLAQVGLSRHLNVRPAWIVPRKTKGPAWWLFAPLVDAFPALGIRADDLGRAMLRAAARTSDGADSTTLENKKLRRLVAE